MKDPIYTNLELEAMARKLAAAELDSSMWEARARVAENANQGMAEKVAELEAALNEAAEEE